jgi:mannose-1-phosphate guanylyltransferase/mannose-6-phosphate isomerase
MQMITPVIMCGGSGTRLWPISRRYQPKQFQVLFGTKSLLQDTALRFASRQFSAPWLLVSSATETIASEQLAQTDRRAGGVIIEPHIRSTGPALASLARVISEIDPDTIVLAMPSDHFFAEPIVMEEAILAAVPAAAAGRIVTFGIVPSYAETGFGYIEVDGVPQQNQPSPAIRFIEKPDLETANDFLQGGRHLWNGGIFLFTPRTMLSQLALHAPDLLEATDAAVERANRIGYRISLNADAYDRCPNLSIDHAVMEKSDVVSVVPVDPGWNDVGSWDAVSAIHPRDENGNAFAANVFADNVENTFILSTGQKVIAANGISDLIVVDSPDALYITKAGHSQGIRQIIEKMQDHSCAELESHSVVERPWGTYQSLTTGQGFQVKHIYVKPGGHLSLQYHHHRAEHWTVVSGTAEVTVGNEVKLIHPNQSVYIPISSVHRLHNPGKVGLHLIEVQCGEYLGEDDIIRVEDIYGRIAAE